MEPFDADWYIQNMAETLSYGPVLLDPQNAAPFLDPAPSTEIELEAIENRWISSFAPRGNQPVQIQWLHHGGSTLLLAANPFLARPYTVRLSNEVGSTEYTFTATYDQRFKPLVPYEDALGQWQVSAGTVYQMATGLIYQTPEEAIHLGRLPQGFSSVAMTIFDSGSMLILQNSHPISGIECWIFLHGKKGPQVQGSIISAPLALRHWI